MSQVRFVVLAFTLLLVSLSLSQKADSAPPPPLQQVLAVLKSLETGDPAAMVAYLTDDHFLQHNLSLGDARDGWIEALPAYQRAGAAVRTMRAFVDGDYVVTHSEYRLSGKTLAGFDVFRFADGPSGRKIVEHWDNLQEQSGPNPGGHTMLDGAQTVEDLSRTEANKALVMSLFIDVFMSGNPQKLPLYVSAESLIQHSPGAADGIDGLRAAAPYAKYNYRSIEKLLGQGNLVLAMSKVSADGKDLALYDLFRLAGGKIVEHWSTLEPIPPAKLWMNTRGKF